MSPGQIGSLRSRCGRKPKIRAGHRERLRQLLGERPGLTLEQMRSALALDCTLAAIHHAWARWAWVTKKTLRTAEQSRPDIVRARRRWIRSQAGLDPARLVFLDESAAKTNMPRLYGWAPRGARLHFACPHGHWRTTTMISSLRLDGSTACMTIDGPTDTEVFQAYVREILCPALRPGDCVVMDNLGTHNNAQTLALIEAVGATVRFLPAYSPDLNPIEMMWSKVKALLRKSRSQNRGRPSPRHRPGSPGRQRPRRHEFFAACGYDMV